MMTTSRRSDSHMATADFPDAVGPQMTGTVASETSAPSEAALELIPREVDDDRSPVDIVRGQLAVAQGDEECPHLRRRKHIPRLDRGLARDRRGEVLVARRRGGRPVAGEGGQRVTETTLRVEARMRRRHRVNDDCLPAEFAELVSQ